MKTRLSVISENSFINQEFIMLFSIPDFNICTSLNIVPSFVQLRGAYDLDL